MYVLVSFASDPADIADPAERMLAELAELDLSLARHVHACATASDDPVTVGDLSRAYQRTARSLRQTLALKAKFARDLLADVREARQKTAREAQAYVERRKARIHAALRPEVWNEHEDYPELWMAELDERLEEAAELDSFLTDPIEAQIARFRADLRLAEPGGGASKTSHPREGGGDGTNGLDLHPPDWRSSA